MRHERTITCPMCGHEIGKISRQRYFCIDCGAEVMVNDKIIKVYKIDQFGYAKPIYSRGISQSI